MSATCVLAAVIAATDLTGAQFVDRDIALVVNLETIALRYGDTIVGSSNTVFFVGEPVTFRVMLNNRLTVPVEVASVTGRWDQAVSFSVRRVGQDFSGVRIVWRCEPGTKSGFLTPGN